MDKVKEKLIERSAKIVSVKDYESRLAAILAKIREESLEKLKWYENHHGKLLAIVLHHESRSDLVPDPTTAFYELTTELKAALAETPDDCSGHDLSSGFVDSSERDAGGPDGPADRASGEPDG
jgi:hypothetical protein